MKNIKVANQKHARRRRPAGRISYVGRRHPELGEGSVLANPFKLKPHGPYEMAECIRLYRVWLWQMFRLAKGEIERGGGEAYEQLALIWEQAQHSKLEREWARAAKLAAEMLAELERLADIAEREELTLLCWCVDERGEGECHARYVIRAIEHIAKLRASALKSPDEESSPDGGGGPAHSHAVPTELLAAAAQSRHSPHTPLC